jgi:hypothetical protein
MRHKTWNRDRFWVKQPNPRSGVDSAMKDHVVALLEAVRRSQDELAAYIDDERAGSATPRETVRQLCGILGDQAVVAAMVELSDALDLPLLDLATPASSRARH